MVKTTENTAGETTKMTIWGLLKNILPYVLPYRGLVAVTLLLTLVGSLMAQVNAVVLDRAVDRINANGARLCDAIATESPDAARAFQRGVDSAIVFVNASTTFADGEQFGMGALVGISTGKVGPRGEIGIEGLTSLKYLVRGTGQTRGRP